MPTLREVRKRIKSAQNIQQITKAMKMVAAAKLRKAQERILAARPYADKIMEVVHDIVEGIEDAEIPLIKQNKDATKQGLILISADKGLCGSYNTNLIKEAMQNIKENPGKIVLYFIGKKGFDAFKKFGLEIEKFKFNDKAIGWFDVEEIGNDIILKYKEQKFSKVEIIYSVFQTSLQQKIVKKQILPVELASPSETLEKSLKNFIFEPSEKVILDNLLDRYVKTILYRAILEAQASEHGVRMIAMEMATNNAAEMIKNLTLLANKTRQAGITKEILEVINGANAIQSG